MERPETDHAKSDQVRMARDVSVMFDELKALSDKHVELHADRARLLAELEAERGDWWALSDRPQRPASCTFEHILEVVVGLIR
jgi:hypothetical protein